MRVAPNFGVVNKDFAALIPTPMAKIATTNNENARAKL